MPVADPIVTIVILFIVLFAIFFVLTYGILQYLERRNSRKSKPKEAIALSSGQLLEPTKKSDSKFCLKCGTKIPRIADYCPECGAEQIPA